jgi:hypothetical protein
VLQTKTIGYVLNALPIGNSVVLTGTACAAGGAAALVAEADLYESGGPSDIADFTYYY